MNSIQGHISGIQLSASLSIVSIQIYKDIVWKVIVVETPETASYLQLDNPVTLLFKETEIVLTQEENIAISIENSIKGEINQVERGALLSKLIIDTKIGDLVVILSTETIVRLHLAKGQKVIALIGMNEIMLSS